MQDYLTKVTTVYCFLSLYSRINASLFHIVTETLCYLKHLRCMDVHGVFDGRTC